MVNVDKLRSSLWTGVRTVIVNSLAADSIDAGVEATYNSKGIGKKPLVVIQPLVVDESTFRFGGVHGRRGVTVIVDIYARSGLTVDTIGDSLLYGLKSTAINDLLPITILDDYSYLSEEGNNLHLLSLQVGYLVE